MGRYLRAGLFPDNQENPRKISQKTNRGAILQQITAKQPEEGAERELHNAYCKHTHKNPHVFTS